MQNTYSSGPTPLGCSKPNVVMTTDVGPMITFGRAAIKLNYGALCGHGNLPVIHASAIVMPFTSGAHLIRLNFDADTAELLQKHNLAISSARGIGTDGTAWRSVVLQLGDVGDAGAHRTTEIVLARAGHAATATANTRSTGEASMRVTPLATFMLTALLAFAFAS